MSPWCVMHRGLFPLGVSADLQSVVKKCPNPFVPGDLQSPVIGLAHLL